MADHDISQDVLRLINKRNRKEHEREFDAWCEELVALPADFELRPRDGTAGIELQPLRWMDSGLDLIQSAKVVAHVQLQNRLQGPALHSYLPYPVFRWEPRFSLRGCGFANTTNAAP